MCFKDNLDMARNMKFLLYLYKMMSGLKINFGKSEVFLILGDDSKSLTYAKIFNCQIDMFPIKCLGVPVSLGRLLYVIGYL